MFRFIASTPSLLPLLQVQQFVAEITDEACSRSPISAFSTSTPTSKASFNGRLRLTVLSACRFVRWRPLGQQFHCHINADADAGRQSNLARDVTGFL
jgi:hypothetical protein